MKTFIFSLIFLVGCSGNPLTERKLTGVSAQAIEVVSNRLDAAQKAGTITQEQETKYQNKLLQALAVLEGAQGYATLPECSKAVSSIECTDIILAYIESILLEAQK